MPTRQKGLLLIVAVLMFVNNINAEEKQNSEKFINDNGFEAVKYSWKIEGGNPESKKYAGGKMSQVSNGRSGDCVKIVNTDKSRIRIYTRKKLFLKFGDTIRFSTWVKGKGSFSFQAWHYNKRFLGGHNTKIFKVDSDKWILKSVEYTIKNKRFEGLESILLVYKVFENSELFFDDFSVTLVKKVKTKITQVTNSKNPTIKYIQRSMNTLEKGDKQLRVLFYGQSITAQAWDKIVESNIRAKYPHAKIEFVNRAIGGFQSENLWKTAYSDLYPYYPDLLIFHVYGNINDFEKIIKTTRQQTSSEIILWSHHIAKSPKSDKNHTRSSEAIAKIANKYNCMFIDVRKKWKQYLKDTNQKPEELLRDTIHLNTEGIKLLGKMIADEIKRSDEFGDSKLYREQIKTITLDSPSVKRNKNGTLELSFSGNKVVAVSTGNVKNASSIMLDGKKTLLDPAQWGISRTSTGPRIWTPAIKRISLGTIPLAENWVLTCLEKSSPDGKKIYFKLKGSKTGEDGEGLSTKDFISNSKRIKIKASDWCMAFPLRFRKIDLPKNFKITWKTYPLSKELFSPGTNGTETVLVQGIKNKKHVLTIKPINNNSTGIAYFIVYKPSK